MKHLKKIFAALIVGFFAFAPPGTLIFVAIFILGVFGKVWFIAGLVVGAILLAIYGFVYRDKLAENRYLKILLRKFRN